MNYYEMWLDEFITETSIKSEMIVANISYKRKLLHQVISIILKWSSV